MTPESGHDWRSLGAEWRLAVGFFTRIPLRPDAELGPAGLARAAWAFPLVGVLVGVAGGIAFSVTDRLGLPIMAMALIAVLATVLLTGGLHEDGLADTVDGLGGGTSREDALAIMRDSRIGAFGVLALLFSVGLRVAALAAMADSRTAVNALVAAHALSRGLLPMAMLWLEPARADGLGAEAGRPTPPTTTAALVIAIAVAMLALGSSRGLAAFALAAVAMGAMAILARRRIGGYTGDTLGATQQIGEIMVLLVASQ
ncbi:MAG TPA: adenosylcobinamide-GDP ribazoletransferase [Stellaceae bacterium]|nr:adenosylcobinamide-GDP ribazoletransferase [Stellaceae bacterium]